MVEHDLGSESQIPLIFPSLGRSVGASILGTLSPIERQQAHRYILVNSSFLDEYRRIFKSELRRSQLRRQKRGTVIDIDRHVHLHFSQWLKQKVENNSLNGISADIQCLAQGPSDKFLKFSAYNINGFKFRTIGRDQELRTQNSGIFVSAETISYASSRDFNPRGGDVSYYGKLTEILELNYYDSFRVVLFKCKWVDTYDARGYKKDEFGHTMVNFSRLIHSGNGEEDEPYVLASQARLVYYVEDPQEKGWNVVVHVQPRDLYDMGDPTISDGMPPETVFEDPPLQSSMNISDNVSNIRLVRQLEDIDNSQVSCNLDDNMEVFICFIFPDEFNSEIWLKSF
ncbi:uncharacterized protein LOC112089662 isoform X5 [Eutrema salsugineum]|uniref:uncharacterized protein LOC112089662 isoform X5 n=2 Tax=Eutrema salsugineum TaxID=72664 RepID=UPI000CED6F4B|nr:uncharacterized protein LOC112089662 isoform X5 [Eutrema salsugineum]